MTPKSNTLDKGLRLLEVVTSHGEAAPIAVLAQKAGLPASTAHRILATLQQRGFVARAARGNYLPGPTLMRLGRTRDLHAVLRAVSRPLLEDLAKRTGMTAHLGIFEGEMVTYLVKAQGDAEVLTKEGLQLEAYCSGIGKVLLAFLPEAERERYLASGPFIPLTPNTIVDPTELKQSLNAARQNGYALDEGEVDPRICCVSGPVWVDGKASAAISLSACGRGPDFSPVDTGLVHLQHTARLLEASLQRPFFPSEAH